MPQALYRKWRPQRWEDVIGQDHIIQTLRNSVAAGRMAHAYLFAGPRGTGKTTTARLLAKAANCLNEDMGQRPCDQCENCLAVNQGRFLDMIEIDAASNTSVEDVRDLRDKINFLPNVGRYKVYIIDEVHMLSTAAFNALLKTLEEPPAHAIFVLATTEVHKIPGTVLSRCQRHEFRRIPIREVTGYLQVIAAGEKLEIDEDALVVIARQSTGCMRDAISLLDQLASGGERITLEVAQQVLGTATNQAVIGMVDNMLAGDAAAGLELIHGALDGGSDARQFARQIVEYLRGLLLIKMNNRDQVDETEEVRAQMTRHAQAMEINELLRVVRIFNQAASELRTGWQPALPLEIAYLEAMQTEQTAPVGPVAANRLKSANPAEKESPAAAGKEIAVGKEIAAQGQKAAAQAPVKKGAADAQMAAARPIDAESSELFEKISAQWMNLVGAVNQRNRQTAAILRSGKPVGMRRGVLLLGFEGQMLKQKLEEPANLEITQSVFAEVLGRAVPVRAIAMKDRQSEIPPDVDIDGLVAAALRDLGGKIVDVK